MKHGNNGGPAPGRDNSFMDREYLYLDEVVKYFVVSPRTVHNWIKAGLVKPEKDQKGRNLFKPADIAAAKARMEKNKSAYVDGLEAQEDVTPEEAAYEYELPEQENLPSVESTNEGMPVVKEKIPTIEAINEDAPPVPAIEPGNQATPRVQENMPVDKTPEVQYVPGRMTKERLVFWIYTVVALVIFIIFPGKLMFLILLSGGTILCALYGKDRIIAMPVRGAVKDFLFVLLYMAPPVGYIVSYVLYEILRTRKREESI
jgi:hypothetical protein